MAICVCVDVRVSVYDCVSFPRYDAPDGYNLWNETTFRMRLWDVGQSAAVAAEAEAMAQLADLTGRPQEEVERYQQRQQQLSALINQVWWWWWC